MEESKELKGGINGTDDNLFEIIGMGGLNDVEKGAVLADLLESIQTRALHRVVEDFTEPQLQELQEVVKTDDPEKLEEFLLANAPNFPSIYEDEAKKLREELIIKFSGDSAQKE